MVKVIAVVGGKRSGKTTVIQHLIRELKSRGYRVGSLKEMPNVRWIDTPEGETWKHGEAGAEVVVGAAINETALFIKRKIGLRELADLLTNLDYLLLEGLGDGEIVAKIVTAKDADEAQRFYDDLTIAISGIIADSKGEREKILKLGVPILSCIVEAGKLADLVIQKAFPVLLNLKHCGECGYNSCYDLARAIVSGATSLRECPLIKREDVVLEVDGKVVPLKSFPALFIKRTLIGMVSSLNGVNQMKEIKIIVKVA